MILARVIAAVIGYICGLFTTGYFLGKAKNIDLHNEGSGNIGMTNALRTLGPAYGALTLIGDCLKVIVAALIAWLIFKNRYPDDIALIRFYAAVFALMGHVFPITMRFKGGKGIASGMGLIIACFPSLFVPVMGLFFILVILTRYVSLGSVAAATALVVGIYIQYFTGRLFVLGQEGIEVIILSTIVLSVVIVRHRENIGRLLKGNERKISLKKSKKE